MKMKDKKGKDKEHKKAAKKILEDDKKRKRGELGLERKEETKDVFKHILIFCDGENTEPSYFEQFKRPNLNIEIVGGEYNTLSLVNKAEKNSKNRKGIQVWCVFDKDDFPAKNFNNAIIKAESLGFGVAYSNQAFEYWLLLHFEDHWGGAMHRKECLKKLQEYFKIFGLMYDKDSKTITKEMFLVLQGIDRETNIKRQDLAIKRAKRNLDIHIKDSKTAAEAESSTTVFKLVEELIKYKS